MVKTKTFRDSAFLMQSFVISLVLMIIVLTIQSIQPGRPCYDVGNCPFNWRRFPWFMVNWKTFWYRHETGMGITFCRNSCK